MKYSATIFKAAVFIVLIGLLLGVAFSLTGGAYTVTFVSEGEVLKTETVRSGGSATAPQDPTKKGNARYSYEFTGWDRDFDKITGDVTVNAVFFKKTNRFEVAAFDTGGRKVAAVTADYGSFVAESELFAEFELGYDIISGSLSVVTESLTLSVETAAEGFAYKPIGDGYEISAGSLSGVSDLKIPLRYRGGAVVAVGDEAFFGRALTGALRLPHGINRVGAFAFENCKISSVWISNTVGEIGKDAFYNCTALKTVYIDSAAIASAQDVPSANGNLCCYAEEIFIRSDLSQIGSYITSNFINSGEFADENGKIFSKWVPKP